MSEPATIGLHLLGTEDAADEETLNNRAREMLSRALNTRRVIGFVGSGVSCAYGYPSWKAFKRRTLEITHKLEGHRPQALFALLPDEGPDKPISDAHRTALHKKPDKLMSEADRTVLELELCETIAEHMGKRDALREKVAGIFRKPNKGHGRPLDIIIERLNITRFLTTNYDLAIEDALKDLFDLPDRPTPHVPYDKEDKHNRKFTASGRGIVSLLHDPRNPEALIQFALAAPGYERGVFHLHGCHTNPKGMIISERDYQRMYLSDHSPHRSYREALNLAFSANPILFLGFGMTEPELLRPLHQFVSSQQYRDTPGRPLFALLPYTKETKQDRSRARLFFHVRYGVNVIFYRNRTDETRTKDLVKALNKIADAWQLWWTSWQKKPPARLPVFSTCNRGTAMIHHRETNQISSDEAHQEIVEIIKKRRSDPKKSGLIVILGGPGTGKGGIGQRLVENEDLYKWKSFFATTHFTNDLLSLIEAAARHFATDEQSNQPGDQRDPIERLATALGEAQHKLLVIGGGERLLEPMGIDTRANRLADALGRKELALSAIGGREHLPKPLSIDAAPTDPAVSDPEALRQAEFPLPDGRPATAEVSRLLDVLRRADSRYNTIILTSAVRPLPLGGFDCHEAFTSANDRLKHEFPWFDDDDTFERLRHAVRGHAYVLGAVGAVLRHFKKRKHEIEARQWVKDVVCRISSMDFPRRPGKVIERILDHATETMRRSKPALRPLLRKVLQHVAVFTTPIPNIAIYTCLLADPDLDVATTLEDVSNALKRLVTFRLLIEIEPLDEDGPTRYTAHTVVRTQVLHDLGGLLDSPGEPQRFELSCFGLGRGDTRPVSDRGHKIVTSGCDALLDCLECRRGEPEKCPKRRHSCPEKPEDCRHHQKEFCHQNPFTGCHADEHKCQRGTEWSPDDKRALTRAAYGLLRSYWSGTAVALHEHLGVRSSESDLPYYSAYQRRLLRLLNVIRRDSRDKLWDLQHEPKLQGYAALYIDELVWLYNELGLVAWCQGAMHDAYGLYRVGQDLIDVAEGGKWGVRWCQSELNLGLLQLERGRLQRAHYHLENAVREARKLNDDVEARAMGFLGLLHHLSGESEQADDLYKRAIEICERGHNRRGLSIFHRHRADLLRVHEKFDAARQELKESIAAAEAGQYYDLLHFARIAEANLPNSGHDEPTMLNLVEPAIEFARRAGLPKLEADAYKVQGEIALKQGDLDQAGRLALRCIEIASSMGMGLRLTAALDFMGRVSRKRGDLKTARGLLRSALQLAEQQGYQTQIEAVERELLEIGPEIGN